MNSMNIRTVASALTMQVSTPALVSATSSALGMGSNTIALFAGALGGAALALLPILRDRKKVQGELKTAPLAYMLRLERNLKPRTVLQWLGDLAHRFRVTN
jgi:tellurite resistance protein TehA-like permease